MKTVLAYIGLASAWMLFAFLVGRWLNYGHDEIEDPPPEEQRNTPPTAWGAPGDRRDRR
jgi:hypothetical protein